MSKDTSSEDQNNEVRETKPDFVRKLPKVKSVQEALAQGSTPATGSGGLDQTPEDAKKKLENFNKKVLGRLEEVSEMLKGAPSEVTPLKDPEFNKFIRNELAYANMHYVVFGRYPEDVDNDPTENNPFLPDGIDPNDVDMSGVDSALQGHPAARAAVARGLDLVGGDEDL